MKNIQKSETLLMYPYDILNTNYNDLNVSPVPIKQQKIYYLIISASDCKRRWRNIRDSYMRKKRDGKCGTGLVAKTKTKWPLMRLLSFLEKVPFERRQVFSTHTMSSKIQ